ncbi:MAG: hypothetical protein J6X42_06245 [Alphaproteobacteria bacterium]|nr:hypothetical protein [Alphaproteobacteria bacterium]
MKKLICTFALMLYATNTMAETIVVIDDNGVVKSQMSTNTVTSPAVINHVVTTSPGVTVVRESPVQTNSYYYDNYSTGSAILAGVTTAVVGALLFDGFKPHHHSKPKFAPVHHHSSPKIAPASHHGGKPHHK